MTMKDKNALGDAPIGRSIPCSGTGERFCVISREVAWLACNMVIGVCNTTLLATRRVVFTVILNHQAYIVEITMDGDKERYENDRIRRLVPFSRISVCK